MIGTRTESYVFADLSLARRLEGTEAYSNARFVEARARVFPHYDACWIKVAGTYAMYDGAASPTTQTFGLGLFEPVTHAVLDEIERFFQDRGAPVYHEVSPLAGLSLVALLNERGYQPVELTSVMYHPVQRGAGLSLPLNEQIHVRTINDEEGELWAQTTARGWSEYPELSDFLLELGRISTRREGALSFLATLNAEPIATGVLCLHGGVALLAGACTIPEGRRQGAQLALLDHRLRHAADQGCDLAMMGAQPGSPSQRNAERHGFRIAYTRIKWSLAKR